MLIIDTRSEAEYNNGHVRGAVNLSPEKFMSDSLPSPVNEIPRDEAIVVYCRSGARSNVVKHILERHGYTNITNGISQGHVEKLLHI